MVDRVPATAVAGQAGQASAAFYNTEVRDPFVAAYAGWTTYVPTFTSSGTAFVRGNGTIDGRYKLLGGDGKSVLFWWRVTFGSSTTYGTGAYTVSLPFQSTALGEQFGVLRYNNGGGNYMVGQWVIGGSTTGASLWVPASSTSSYLVTMSGTTPTPTPASGGWLTGEATIYERT